MPATADRTTGQIPTPSERLSPRAQLEHVVREANRLLAAMGSALRDATGEGNAEGAQVFNHLSLQDHRLMDLAEPTVDTDAATKNYVDSQVSTTLADFRDNELGEQVRRESLSSHHELDELATYDSDHTNLVAVATARTISAVHTFSPAVPGVPFILAANALGQLVTGFNADQVDGFSVLTGTTTVDVGSIASLGTASFTLAIVGAVPGDPVAVGPPAAIEAGLVWNGYISANDVCTIVLFNSTAGAVDPANATWHAVAIHLG